MPNPFVYGEVVPGGGVRRSRGRARPARRRSAGRPEGVPHLAAPLRQVVAGPAGACARPSAGRADGRGHGQQLQLVRRVPRRLRPRARWPSRPSADRARTWLRDISSASGRRCASSPTRTAPASSPCRSRRPHRRATSRGSRRKSSRCPAASPRPRPQGGRRARRVPGDRGFNGGSVEHALRAAVQHQRQVGYVFAGSEPSLMERMIGRSRPFYKAGPVMRLQKIPADRFAAFIEARFSATGVCDRSRASAPRSSTSRATCPYDVQRLAHEAWDDVRAAADGRADARRPARDAGAAARRTGDASSRRSGSG